MPLGGTPDDCSWVAGVTAGLAEALRLPQAGGASLLMLAEGFLGRGRSMRDGLDLELAILWASSPFDSSVILTAFPVTFLLLFEPSSSSHCSTDFRRLSCHEMDSTGGQDSTICYRRIESLSNGFPRAWRVILSHLLRALVAFPLLLQNGFAYQS